MLSQKEIQVIQKSFQGKEGRLSFIFQALADSTRLKIFQLLSEHHDICVTDVAKVFNISVPAASYQFKIMEVVGLVKRERMGKMICYELNKRDPLVKKAIQVIRSS